MDVLRTLALRVRCLSLDQIARVWWPDARNQEDAVRARLRTFERAGLLRRVTVDAAPRLDLEGPILAWSVGEAKPDCGAMSWQLRKRWGKLTSPLPLYVATAHGANLFGAFADRPPRENDVDHDLHLSEVYLYYRRRRPQEAGHWLGEAVFPKAGKNIKDPDAFIVDEGLRPIRVVEFGGRYDQRRVAAFHDHCADQELPYELW